MSHGTATVGAVEVTVVCEGFAPLTLADEMPGAAVDWASERAAHPWAFHGNASWAWHVHAFALRTAAGVVMVDAGLGRFPPYRPWAQAVDRDAALRTAGVQPEAVGAVVHTHLHADHAGGAVIDGRPRFPNAVHHAHPADWAYFGGADRIGGYTARGPMAVLDDLGKLDLQGDDHAVAEGIRVVHAPGHTPGHRVAILESRGETLVLTGDLLHLPVQVARPDVPSSHDEDAEIGCRSRSAILERARSGGWRVAVSHFARPFGRVEAGGWRSKP